MMLKYLSLSQTLSKDVRSTQKLFQRWKSSSSIISNRTLPISIPSRKLPYTMLGTTKLNSNALVRFQSTVPNPESKDPLPDPDPDPLAKPTLRKSGFRQKDPVSPVSWRSVAIAASVGGLLLGFMFFIKKEKENALAKERKRTLGKASIGGRFDLIDHEGKPAKSEDFFGKWVLLYFGFTHCPDVCPEELEKLAKVTELIESNKNLDIKVQPLFITVDPARDSVAAVKKYIREFSERFIGLTGTPEQIQTVCKAYRVYFSAGPRDYEDDYIVDHTIIIYMVNPDGEFVDYFGQTKTAEDIYGALLICSEKYKAMKSKWF